MANGAISLDADGAGFSRNFKTLKFDEILFIKVESVL
jgi:hypothetical protein